tara:strand:- start:78 stop:506 length:429 start_codon:yes stop_codon:yes gene_type:complete
MIKNFLIIITLLLNLNIHGQKKKITYDKETGIIQVNGEDYAQLAKENAPGQLGINKNFTISNLEGDELIYMVFKQRSTYPNGPNGKEELRPYYQMTFLESNRYSKKNGTMYAIGAAKIVAKNDLIKNGKIDAAAEKKFHIKY